MSGYIKRENALKKLCYSCSIHGNGGKCSKCEAYKEIQNLPSVDVVEVVRCKDCKYAHLTYNRRAKYCDLWKDDEGNFLELYLDGDFYCADGERKGDD